MPVARHTRSMASLCLRKRRKVSLSHVAAVGAVPRGGSRLPCLGGRWSPLTRGRSSARPRRSLSSQRWDLVAQPSGEGLSLGTDSPPVPAPSAVLPVEQPPAADNSAFVAALAAVVADADAVGLGAVVVHHNAEPPDVPVPPVPVVVLAEAPDPAVGDVAPARPPLLGAADPAADGDDAESIPPAPPAVAVDDGGPVSSSTGSDESINDMLHIDPMTPDGRRALIRWMLVTSRYHNRQPRHFP